MSNPEFQAEHQPDSAIDKNSGSRTAKPEDTSTSLVVGWREWVGLPDLGLPAIKAKVDTGARTSAIHASDIQQFQQEDGTDWVSFTVMPIQRLTNISRRCHAPLVDIRKVTDSGGHSEERFFISTSLVVGGLTRVVEVTLAQRTDMLFRMLLGRTSMVPGIVVNPQLSYTLGRVKARAVYTATEGGTSE